MPNFNNDIVVVLDVDGVLTDGTFYSTKDGKFLKCFGPDDSDMLKEIMKCCQVQFISADKKGWEITKHRIVDEMGWNLECVSHLPEWRWKWMKDKFPDKKIIFIADGVFDYYAMAHADYSICPCDALDHVKDSANYVSKRSGAERFVADACIQIIYEFGLDINMDELGVNCVRAI
jgi:3-deoxy-D-manno-octulosonate 8-phosphate phosphatase (KDO 8-P phosphatase)